MTLNKYCGSNLPPIKYDGNGTIKDACDTFIARIKEIQDEVVTFNKQLEDKLGTEVFQNLSGMMEYSNNSFEIARKAIPAVKEGVVFAGAIALFITTVILREEVTMLCCCVSAIGYSVVGAVCLGVVLLGVDMIISAILGAMEKKRLESALTEYRKHLDDIKPASRAFQRSVVEIQVLIKNRLK